MIKKFLIVYQHSKSVGNTLFTLEKTAKFNFFTVRDIEKLQKYLDDKYKEKCVIINIIELENEKTN